MKKGGNMFEEVDNLIELKEENDNLAKAKEILLNMLNDNPDNGEIYGRLSQVCYWQGEYAEKKDKLAIFEEGKKYGEKGVELAPDSVHTNLWCAVNMGLYGYEKGISDSLFLVEPMEKYAKKALEIDESFFYGAPHRVLGKLYTEAPAWPMSVGDYNKAIEHLQKALEFGPDYLQNHLFIAEAYIAKWQNDKAKEHLEIVLKADPTPNMEKFDAIIKDYAKKVWKTFIGGEPNF